MSDPKNVAILIFDDVEVLDFAGPFEVFNVAGELIKPTPFHTYTVGVTGDPIKARGALQITPHYSIADCPPPALLIIPGGWGTRRLVDIEKMGDDRAVAWVKAQAGIVELLLSVCTGALVLAKAGCLINRPATTHHTAFDLLAELSPSTTIIRDKRFVESDNITTSGGISAGIDMALHIVEAQLGSEALSIVKKEMEWGWFAGV